ncbi:MAG: bifunctional riboflavin kinase/FAD synthetase [Pseudomonadota bacterium]
MKVYRGLPDAASRAPCALAIGNFDGLHRGHQILLSQLKAAATARKIDTVVMTFEPHPREFFALRSGDISLAPARIANLRDKLQALACAGVDKVVVERFNEGFAALSPAQFVKKILTQGLQVKWLLVGEDFGYGAGRAGNIDTLAAEGRVHGFEVATLATVYQDSERISSSVIRAALQTGEFSRVAQLLGRPYMISGRVIHGRKLGRTLGFPTMNLALPHRRPALSGIFVVKVHGLSSEPLPGVASLGIRPTVEDAGRLLLEVHVLDYVGQCYGDLVQVEFLEKLRDEEKYVDLPSLTAAIANDSARARAFFLK